MALPCTCMRARLASRQHHAHGMPPYPYRRRPCQAPSATGNLPGRIALVLIAHTRTGAASRISVISSTRAQEAAALNLARYCSPLPMESIPPLYAERAEPQSLIHPAPHGTGTQGGPLRRRGLVALGLTYDAVSYAHSVPGQRAESRTSGSDDASGENRMALPWHLPACFQRT